MPSMTNTRVRPLSLEDLKLTLPVAGTEGKVIAPEFELLPDDNPVLVEVRAAIDLGFAGVILSGPPGTGKSWYAKRIAQTVASGPDEIRIVQFHTSYQYEDFMEGFVPRDGGGFELQKKVFPLLCVDASEQPNQKFVLVIDEISRCDVARVFGEALTYMELDKRGLEFTMSSGSALTVPSNLIIIATMNPWDKGVDEMDVALERRFAQIDMPPSVDALRKILLANAADPAFVERVAEFFISIQNLEDETVRLGHAYFNNCIDENSSRRVWSFRLLPFFKKACRLDPTMLASIQKSWLRVVPSSNDEVASPATGPSIDPIEEPSAAQV
ncbi:McrB family protein [Rhizobium tumorigenes]|uniref:AAA family ATPase n=1 Tax=Rhizobium tumorigenes TaxID=2041385 RepID=A0AAF1KA87_9HYPH|nr:AAA family ATPase [Rhizobium tumorigenes]WFR95702.1 AAA family ATPase [Rhizobium tumorigenes]